MGVSTDAILFWGIVSTDEDERWLRPSDEDEEGDVPDWEARYAAAVGVPEPSEPYGEESKPLYHDYWDRKRAAIEASGCSMGTHCSGDYPMDYVTVVASKTRASRGCPQEIRSLEVGPDWEAKLRDFCAQLGIPWQEPGWWLVSYWG
jgi:hypothetical protein